MNQSLNFKQTEFSIKDEILSTFNKTDSGNLLRTGTTRSKCSASTGKPTQAEFLFKYVDKYYTREERKIIFGYVRPYVTDTVFVDTQIEKALGTAHSKPDFHTNTHFANALWLTRKMVAPPLETFVIHHNDTRALPQNRAVNPELPYSANAELRKFVKSQQDAGLINGTRFTYGAIEDHVLIASRKELHAIKTLPSSRFKAANYKSQTTIHQRSQLQTKASLKEKVKVRATFGHSKHSLIRNRMLRGDYDRQLRNIDHKPIAWGYEIGKGGFHNIYSESYRNKTSDDMYVMTDFKSFDHHLPNTGMRMIDAIVGSYMHTWKEYFPQKLDGDERYMYAVCKSDNDLYRLMKRHRAIEERTELICPDGIDRKVKHSLLISGCGETQSYGSIWNIFCLVLTLLNMGYTHDELDTYLWTKALGDDNIFKIFKLPGYTDEEWKVQYARTMKEVTGMLITQIAIQPTLVGCQFLGYTCQENLLPARDELELVARLLFPERQWTKESIAGSLIGIAISDYGQHERLHKMCNEAYLDLLPTIERVYFTEKRYYLTEILGIDLKQLEELSHPPFPSRDAIIAKVIAPVTRSWKDLAHTWPNQTLCELANRDDYFFADDDDTKSRALYKSFPSCPQKDITHPRIIKWCHNTASFDLLEDRSGPHLAVQTLTTGGRTYSLV